MQQPAVFYLHQLSIYTAELRQIRKKLLIVSLLRITSFFILAFSVYLFFAGNYHYSGYLITASLLVFLVLLRFFSGYRSQKVFLDKLLYITENEIKVAENGLNRFPDGSNLSKDAVYADDLDIYGRGSLYHYLNRTTTTHGAEALGRVLNNPPLDPETIKGSQDATRSLSGQPLRLQHLVARGLSLDTAGISIGEVERWIKDKSRLSHSSFLKIIRFVLPVVNVASLIYYLDRSNPIPLGTGVVLSWLVISRYASYVNTQHTSIGRKQTVLQQYASILMEAGLIEERSSTVITEIKQTASEGNKAIRQLSQLSSMFDQRLNLLVNIFLNSLFIYDVQCMMSLEQWKEKHRQDFRQWIETVGDLEKFVSLGIFAYNHPDYTYPVISDSKPFIHATSLAHPLIADAESVSNDFHIGDEERIVLVTGSNMSGKSTFLRTIGVNVLLAQCGTPVRAAYLEFSPVQILSSIRISDSLQEHTSYFMAELKRLKWIIEQLETGKPSLVLIDEVLRGTNSEDKTHGSEALIRKLTGYNALTLFATHDLSLSALEHKLEGLLSNYCFESSIVNGELLFDFKLQPGVAKNKNATFLLQKMDII